MESPLAKAQPVHHVIAALAPLFVVLVAGIWLTRPSATEARSERAQAQEEALAEGEARVVVIGNSTADRAIDRKALAQALGMDKESIDLLIETGSRAPAWYAMLDNRVVRQGHTPELIVIMGEFPWLLETASHSQSALAQIEGQLGDDPGLVGELTFGQDSQPGFVRRARVRASAIRADTLDGIRDLAVGVLLAEADAEGTVLEAGDAYAEAAMERLFGSDSSVVMDLHTRVVPVVEVERSDPSQQSGLPPVESGYVPGLVELAERIDSRILFVRVPLRSDSPVKFQASVEQRRDLVALLNERGAGWLDLSDLDGVSDRHFADAVHLNLQGRDLFTKAFIEALRELDALGEGEFDDAALPARPPLAERLGTPAPLTLSEPRVSKDGECLVEVRAEGLAMLADSKLNQAGYLKVSPLVGLVDGVPMTHQPRVKDLGTSCDGTYAMAFNPKVLVAPPDASVLDDPSRVSATLTDALPLTDRKGRQAFWVYPGTEVRFTFEDALQPTDKGITAQVTAVAFSEGKGVPELWLGEASQELAPVGEAWTATTKVAGEVRTVGVKVPEDGPFLLLFGLSVDEADGLRWPVLTARTGPDQLVLAGARGLANGQYGKPPPLQTSEVKEKKGMAFVNVPRLAGLDPTQVERVASKACPLAVVTRNGRPLQPATDQCVPSKDHGPQWACHRGTKVGWTAQKGNFEVELDPSRQCRFNWWLYPGDNAVFQVGGKKLRSQPPVMNALTLEAVTLGDGNAQSLLTVQLWLDDHKVLDEQVPLASLANAPRLPLPRTFTQVQRVKMQLSTTDGAPFVMLKQAVLEL